MGGCWGQVKGVWGCGRVHWLVQASIYCTVYGLFGEFYFSSIFLFDLLQDSHSVF
jgi:hypothetical protein